MSYFNQSNVPSVIGNFFTVDGANLTIHVTDIAGNPLPLEKIQDTYKGMVCWYTLEDRMSSISKHWRKTLGNELCQKFLFLSKTTHISRYHPYSNTISRAESGDVRFTLTDFPAGYNLYTHHVGSGAIHDDIRTDTYLCGGGHKFRSPKEALCHLAWLMSGKPLNRCRCIYDDKSWGRKQGSLNKAMKAEWEALTNDRRKREFRAFQRNEKYIPPVGVNKGSFLRPN